MNDGPFWPHGLCRDLALLDVSAVDQLDFDFYPDADDFTPYIYSIIDCCDDLFALRLREGQPLEGYVLIEMDNEQPKAAQLARFMAYTGLQAEHLIWEASSEADDW